MLLWENCGRTVGEVWELQTLAHGKDVWMIERSMLYLCLSIIYAATTSTHQQVYTYPPLLTHNFAICTAPGTCICMPLPLNPVLILTGTGLEVHTSG